MERRPIVTVVVILFIVAIASIIIAICNTFRWKKMKKNLKPFLTDKIDAYEAIQAYINGTLDNHVERLH